MSELANEYKFECYRKLKPLGVKNNMWLVEDSVTGKCFVMRKLPLEAQEVYRRLALIHHANIVEIADIFTHEGFLYVIEEHLEGKLLSDEINVKKFSHHQVLSVGRQLFNALVALHEHNIVHRDIKPENIIMDAYGNVKLIDFDIARIFAVDKNGDTTVKGSRDYAPPEQFGFTQSDQRTDIYSLGVTLNELAVGKLPEEKMCTGKPAIIIRRCIEFDPKRRYQNAAQALQHIDRLENKTTIFVCFAAFTVTLILLLSLLIYAEILIVPVKPGEESMQISEMRTPKLKAKEHDDESLQQESHFDSTAYLDRIIYVQEPEQYPAFIMANDQEYECLVSISQNLSAGISAKKENDKLFLECRLKDGDIFAFEFDDVFSDIYEQQGYANNTDFEKTSPEYEILLDDLDSNGVLDLLVTLAWRRRVDTPDSANHYYLTEYSTLWVIYMTEDNKLNCSEPLYFNGCTPELQTETLLFDYEAYEWYFFQNGIWETGF